PWVSLSTVFCTAAGRSVTVWSFSWPNALRQKARQRAMLTRFIGPSSFPCDQSLRFCSVGVQFEPDLLSVLHDGSFIADDLSLLLARLKLRDFSPAGGGLIDDSSNRCRNLVLFDFVFDFRNVSLRVYQEIAGLAVGEDGLAFVEGLTVFHLDEC